MKIVIDTNIYDLLANDNDTTALLKSLTDSSNWQILAPATLVDELKVSPFQGVPTWLTVQKEADEVFVLGHSKLGSAKLGHGGIYSEHRGSKKNVSDSVIVDFAVKRADIFVSEDKRSRNGLKKLNTNTLALTYEEFQKLVVQAQKSI